jgi:hypothetical protein
VVCAPGLLLSVAVGRFRAMNPASSVDLADRVDQAGSAVKTLTLARAAGLHVAVALVQLHQRQRDAPRPTGRADQAR